MALLCPRCTSSTIWFSSFRLVSFCFVSFRIVRFSAVVVCFFFALYTVGEGSIYEFVASSDGLSVPTQPFRVLSAFTGVRLWFRFLLLLLFRFRVEVASPNERIITHKFVVKLLTPRKKGAWPTCSKLSSSR